MTAARHGRKLSLLCLAIRLAAALALGGVLVLPLGAATTEYIVVDRNTGLAINGFDPVAYFTDAAPIVGKGEFELTWEGAVWRFRNDGNRAAFAANPEVYMPRFGGYDPIGVTRGVGVAGDPRLWLVSGERLYLFYTREARDAFAADAEEVRAVADRNWPSVQRTLSP
jgi:hypothetical protein